MPVPDVSFENGFVYADLAERLLIISKLWFIFDLDGDFCLIRLIIDRFANVLISLALLDFFELCQPIFLLLFNNFTKNSEF